MATIAELKEKLAKKGLPTSGKKQVLIDRLAGKKQSVSVKPKTKGKKVTTINYNKMATNPMAIFYITTYFQNPKSQMAKNWVKSQGLSHNDAKHFFNIIMKK